MLEKRNSRNFTYWLWFYLLKRCNFLFWHFVMENLTTEICTKLYQNRPRFVKDTTKTLWCVFRFTVLTAVHFENARMLSFTRSQGKVETLFRWGGKRSKFYATNLLRIICTKFYHNRSGFVDCVSKTFWCVFFWLTVYINGLHFIADCLWLGYLYSAWHDELAPWWLTESPKIAEKTPYVGSRSFKVIEFVTNRRTHAISYV